MTVQGVKFRIALDSVLAVQSSGYRTALVSELTVQGPGCRVQGLGVLSAMAQNRGGSWLQFKPQCVP